MHGESLIEIQNRIVVATARGIQKKWDAAVVNIEIDFIDGERTENCLCLSFKKMNNRWTRDSFEIPYECYDMFVALREATDPWTSCTLEFTSDGNYEFKYAFEPPRRLNGIHDDQAMLANYTPLH